MVETWYPTHPLITDDSSGNQWVFMALRSSNSGINGFAGRLPQSSGTTQFRYMYQISSGSSSGYSGGLAEASSTHMYFTSGCPATNTLHLLKVNKTTGAIDWQRRYHQLTTAEYRLFAIQWLIHLAMFMALGRSTTPTILVLTQWHWLCTTAAERCKPLMVHR